MTRRPSSFLAPHHRAEVLGRPLDVPLLRDVVDPTLDDEHVRAGRALLESRRDLVGSLAVDAAVAEPEARIGLRRPVLPLALRIESVADLLSHRGIGIPGRRAGSDRVAERGNDDLSFGVHGRDLTSVLPAATGGQQCEQNVDVDAKGASGG